MNTSPEPETTTNTATPSPMASSPVPPSHDNFYRPGHGATELLDPSFVPLKMGSIMTPYPAPHPQFAFKPIKWYWLPGFRFDLIFLLSSLAFTCSFSAILVLALAPSAAGKAAGSIVLGGLASLITYCIGNILINQTLRTAICRCFAKRDEAIRLWEERLPESQSIYQKDQFHEERTWFFHLVVLRDGVVEIRSGNADRIREVSGSSLDIGMQGKLGGAFGDVVV